MWASIFIVSPVTTSQIQLLQSMLGGPGVTISNITYNGSSLPTVWNNIGTFTTGSTPTNLGITSGLILSTGGVSGAVGPNNSGSFGIALTPSTPDLGDSDLYALVGSSVSNLHDASVLEFDFIPATDTIKFRYVFGSEEYPEYITSYNDVFAFFISGPNPAGGLYNKKNIAILPTTNTNNDYVSIYNVNNGVTNTGPCKNCVYYINNIGDSSLQADAHTTVLTAWAHIVPCQKYHFKLAIADANDRILDSWVWLDAGTYYGGALAGQSTVCQGQQNFPLCFCRKRWSIHRR